MSNTCTGSDCSNKIAEYKNGIDKLLKRLRESENQRSEYEIQNLTLKQKLNRPSKSETKHFQRMFNLIHTLMDNHFEGKSKKDESIRDVFLGMIDSIWSLLAARYTDIDSWLDLKYLGTNLVETLTSFDQTQGPEKSEDLDTIANLKKGEEFKESDFKLEFNKENFAELTNELDTLKGETSRLTEKILEQNCVIKNLCKSFAKKLNKEKQQQILNTSNNSTATGPSSSSGRLSCSSNEISSGSFNLNSSQNTNPTLNTTCPDDKQNVDTRSAIRISTSQRDGVNVTTMSCPTCRKLVDMRRCSMEKFEKHIVACKEICTNVPPKGRDVNHPTELNINALQQRKWSGSSIASNSSSNSSSNQQVSGQSRPSSDQNSKNYMIIQDFKATPRKRL